MHDFSGSIPANYDRYLVPLLFRPYADELARIGLRTCGPSGSSKPRRAPEWSPRRSAQRCRMPRSSPPISIRRCSTSPRSGSRPSRVTFRQADAHDLPFEDASFDLVVCQFGVMFFPDKVKRQFGGAPRAARWRPLPHRDLGRDRAQSAQRRRLSKRWSS